MAQIEDMHRAAEKEIAANHFREAIRLYDDIILLEPDDDVAYANMGNTYLILGYDNKAKDAFHQALDINPDNEDASIGLRKIADPDSV